MGMGKRVRSTKGKPQAVVHDNDCSKAVKTNMDKGRITNFFVPVDVAPTRSLRRGRPKKKQKPGRPQNSLEENIMAKDRARLEAACKAREEERTAILKRSKKQKRISFSTNKVAWDLLNACINTWDAKSCDEKMRWGEQRTHLNEFVLRAQDIGIRLSVRTMEPYLADVGVRKCLPPFGYTLRGKPRLLSKDDENAVIEIVAKSDEQNRGLTTGECIVLIEDMRPDLSTAQARVALKHAKKVGSKEGLLKTNMQGIQNTTKERTAISPRQQARWYYFVKYMWSLLEELNFARRGCVPTRDWHRCKPYAIWNYDEECIIACDHRVRTVGSRNVMR